MVAVLRAQRLGYTHVGYNFDTLDWLHAQDPNGTATDIPLPDLSSGAHVTVLAHDAGGPNRERTVEYVHLLIEHARANGYTFHTLLQLTGAPPAANAPVQATAWDGFALAITQVLFGWPEYLMRALFALAILLLVVAGGINTVLALVRHRRRRRQVWPGSDEMRVPTSVVLAAYNEEAVIARTLETILASVYPYARSSWWMTARPTPPPPWSVRCSSPATHRCRSSSSSRRTRARRWRSTVVCPARAATSS